MTVGSLLDTTDGAPFPSSLTSSTAGTDSATTVAVPRQHDEGGGAFLSLLPDRKLMVATSSNEMEIDINIEDRQSREVDKEIANVSIIEYFLDEFATVLGVLDSLCVESCSSSLHVVEELTFLNHREFVVVDLDDLILAVIRVVRRVVHGCVFVEGL